MASIEGRVISMRDMTLGMQANAEAWNKQLRITGGALEHLNKRGRFLHGLFWLVAESNKLGMSTAVRYREGWEGWMVILRLHIVASVQGSFWSCAFGIVLTRVV